MSICTPAGKARLRGGPEGGVRGQVGVSGGDQGGSVSAAVSVGVKVAGFCQVQVFPVTKLKGRKERKINGDME